MKCTYGQENLNSTREIRTEHLYIIFNRNITYTKAFFFKQ